MSELFAALRGGLGFLTTIPVGITMEGIEKLMRHAYLFPVVGAFLGLMLAVIAFASLLIFPPVVTTLIIIISIYYLTGINHIDGLADFGDGVASHGTREEKIKAMRDTSVGVGGLMFCVFTLLGAFASLFSIAGIDLLLIPYALIIAETCAKQSMVTVAAFGKKLHEGFGAMTVENTKKSDFITGMLFTGIVCYFFLGPFGVEAFIVSQLAALLVLHNANRHFGGVSGDVIGAANEIGRLAALLYTGGLAWTLF